MAICFRWARRLTLASASFVALVDIASAQDSWRPERISATSQARPLASTRDQAWVGNQPGSLPSGNALGGAAGNAAAVPATTMEELGGGVGLRWKPAQRSETTAATSAAAAFDQIAGQQPQPHPAGVFRSNPAARGSADARVSIASQPTHSRPVATNPLRSAVSPAAYQQRDNTLADPFGDLAPQQPQRNPFPGSAAEPVPAFPGTERLQDPLADPELPPPPTTRLPNIPPGQPGLQDPSPFDRPGLVRPEVISPAEGDELDELPRLRRPRRAATDNCDELRNRIRSFPITDIDLDVSPSYGVGIRSDDDEREMRLRERLVESLESREWRDYRGRNLGYGRLLDLRDDRVILDVNGVERAIPFRDLSDLDVAYVGEVWNLPSRCGTGFEPFEGRQFVASSVQWTASGLCHKPLYFEQVQLERYGHTLGPILQPVVSSAHFFGSIAVLPYQQGIHPPNECQYALGYYRPGDCAPYMLRPIPWSLRGGLTQAAAVTGAVGLIP
jgi:hypothetical protein